MPAANGAAPRGLPDTPAAFRSAGAPGHQPPLAAAEPRLAPRSPDHGLYGGAATRR
jgi:hypothetical protein